MCNKKKLGQVAGKVECQNSISLLHKTTLLGIAQLLRIAQLKL